MKRHRTFFITIGILFFAAQVFTAEAQAAISGGPVVPLETIPMPTNALASAPTYVPDTSHQNDPLPEGVIAWDAVIKSMDAAADLEFARFTFSFTNIAVAADITLVTNVTDSSTNIVATTNSITPVPITILDVHPSCGCTTAELPPVPWTLPPGTSGQIKLALDLRGKMGVLVKPVTIKTDKGKRDIMLRVTMLPPVVMTMTEEQKAAGIAAAKVDRQAVFKGECATCHLKNIEGKNGQPLYAALCGICHEAEHRATMVTDLNKLTVPTSEEFWRTWITYGKPGSLMPAFATSQGGPLTDMQIASLAVYLNTVHPSHPTNAPAN